MNIQLSPLDDRNILAGDAQADGHRLDAIESGNRRRQPPLTMQQFTNRLALSSSFYFIEIKQWIYWLQNERDDINSMYAHLDSAKNRLMNHYFIATNNHRHYVIRIQSRGRVTSVISSPFHVHT